MEGSGKVSIHDSIVGPDLERNSTLSKRCLWVRGTHDLETRQHPLSAVGSSCRWSTMTSRISGGRESNIVVSTKGDRRCFPLPRGTCSKYASTVPLHYLHIPAPQFLMGYMRDSYLSGSTLMEGFYIPRAVCVRIASSGRRGGVP